MQEQRSEGADGSATTSGRPPRRAGAAAAIGSMSLIAVLAAGAVVLVMRLGGGHDADRPPVGHEEEVPAELAGGIDPAPVPPAVAAAVDLPVVGARVLEALPDGIDGCDMGLGGAIKEVESVLATPDGVSVSLLTEPPDDSGFPPPPPPEAPVGVPGPPPDAPGEAPAPREQPAPGEEPTWRESCLLAWAGGVWMTQGGTGGPVGEMAGVGTSVTCCDEQGLATASSDLVPPAGAAWALQERGAYWLAYPVTDGGRVTVSWRFQEPTFGPTSAPTHVLWLDEAGSVLDEGYISA